MFNATRCPAGAKATDAVPDVPPDVRLLAIALLRVGDDAEPAFVQLTVSMNKMRHSYLPVQATAESFAKGMTEDIPKSTPGAVVHGGHATTRLLTAHGLPMARIVCDVDGLSGGYAILAPRTPSGRRRALTPTR